MDYPIQAVANLYGMYFATAWNQRLAARFDPRGNAFLEQAERAHARDAELVREYHALLDGKWDAMMSQVHTNYVIGNDPVRQNPPVLVRTAGDVPEKMRNARGVRRSRVRLRPDPHRRRRCRAPRAEYDVTLPENRGIELRLRLAPTLDMVGRGGVRIGISLDDGPVQTLVSDLEPTGGGAETEGRKRWYAAVIDNRAELSAEFDPLPAGRHTVKLWRLDDNVVVESLEIVPR